MRRADGGRGRMGFCCFFVCVLLKTPPFKETCAWPTDEVDEVEKRRPGEDQSDEGDGDHEGDEFVRHGSFSWITTGISAGILRVMGSAALRYRHSCCA